MVNIYVLFNFTLKGVKRQSVKWVGPSGEIDSKDNREMISLLHSKVIWDEYGKDKMKFYEYGGKKIVNYVRDLFKKYELKSPYHDFSHNYVTMITALRAFIGAIKEKEKLAEDDLRCLLIASIFHDTGYLVVKKGEDSMWARTHSRESRLLMKRSLKDVIAINRKKFEKLLRDIKDYEAWKVMDIEKIISLQKYTNYSRWKVNKKRIKRNKLAQILVGADLLQVTDKNYFQNRHFLEAYIVSMKGKDHRPFIKFEREGVRGIWPFLDSYYGGRKKNPYRKRWEIFEKRILGK